MSNDLTEEMIQAGINFQGKEVYKRNEIINIWNDMMAAKVSDQPNDFRNIEPWASIVWRAENILRAGHQTGEDIWTTTEKLRADLGFHYPAKKREIVEDEGWISFEASKNAEMPTDANSRIDVKYRDGLTGTNRRAARYFWGFNNDEADIIAWRPTKVNRIEVDK